MCKSHKFNIIGPHHNGTIPEQVVNPHTTYHHVTWCIIYIMGVCESGSTDWHLLLLPKLHNKYCH